MRIGIDLHTIDHIMQGSRTYIVALTQALLAIDRRNSYVLYLPEDGSGRELFTGPNVIFRAVPPGNRILRLGLTFPSQLWEDRVDVFHCQYIGPFIRTCRMVVTIHDILHERHPDFFPKQLGRMMRLSYPVGARLASAIVTGSETTRTDLLQLYNVNPARIHVTPYAVSPDFSPASQPDPTSTQAVQERYGIKPPFILSLGRIEPRKNLTTLVEAFRRIVDAGVRSHTLVIAGSVDPLFQAYHDDLAARVSSAVVPIRLTGPIAQEDIITLYRAADLFVYPSFAEGFGLPVLEAMACGTATVASNTTSIPEVTGPDGAQLVDPQRADLLGDVMARLIANPDQRAALAQRGLERSRTFSWRRCAEQTLSVYQSLSPRP